MQIARNDKIIRLFYLCLGLSQLGVSLVGILPIKGLDFGLDTMFSSWSC